MVLAAVRDGLYNTVLTLHIIAVIAAFAPAVVHPLTAARTKQEGGEAALPPLARVMAANGRAVYLPALIAVGVLGIVLVLLSDEVWEFTDAWVIASILLWIAITGIASGMILPAERALAAGDLAAEKKVAMGGQLATIGLIVMLWLMVFKPGA